MVRRSKKSPSARQDSVADGLVKLGQEKPLVSYEQMVRQFRDFIRDLSQKRKELGRDTERELRGELKTRFGLTDEDVDWIILANAEELPLKEVLELNAPMTMEMACQYLQCHRNSLQTWIRDDTDFPAHRAGREYRFYRSELDEWLRSRKKM